MFWSERTQGAAGYTLRGHFNNFARSPQSNKLSLFLSHLIEIRLEKNTEAEPLKVFLVETNLKGLRGKVDAQLSVEWNAGPARKGMELKVKCFIPPRLSFKEESTTFCSSSVLCLQHRSSAAKAECQLVQDWSI